MNYENAFLKRYFRRKTDGDTSEIKMEMMSTDVAGQENVFLNEFLKSFKFKEGV